jgi:hypothetical protein
VVGCHRRLIETVVDEQDFKAGCSAAPGFEHPPASCGRVSEDDGGLLLSPHNPAENG